MVALSSHWAHTLGFVDGVTWLFSALVVESSCCSLDIPWFEELKACHKRIFHWGFGSRWSLLCGSDLRLCLSLKSWPGSF